MPLRIVFMGTPDFAVPSLDALYRSEHEIVGVVTATDKLGGRGKKQVIVSAVKKYAVEVGLPVLQPPNLKKPEFVSSLQALNADLQVVVAFRMLPQVVWDMPPMGTMNLHGSLLPKYRGAAPINWAIINGDKETGVSTFLLKQAIDTGDLLMQRTLPIGPNDSAGDVHDTMMHLGAEVVLASVSGLASGTIKPTAQNEAKVSHAPKIFHETCVIDFSVTAELVHNFIRGLSPFPAAWTVIDDKEVKILKAKIAETEEQLVPGEIVIYAQRILLIGCAQGAISILELKMEGKRPMSVADFLNGYTIQSKSVGHV